MKITKEVDIEITPIEAAKAFASWGSNNQALFFEELAKEIIDTWDGVFCPQVKAIMDSKNLTDKGREIMRIIGEYSCKE